ncbi:MAG: LD-carboxypeptidase [Candidatus Gastranaerophilales bacterium]|nr:LD-carboxypeptidase [Candidatus Gastranaerophilales bacterium]
MRYPNFLQREGVIGLVAPAFGCAIGPYRSRFENAQKKWKAMGYRLDLGPNCYADKGIGISNTPEECAAELTAYYVSGDNDCLISCGGGELMCETISHVDFDRIREAVPKWYMGYSDNTNMTYLLATLCDTASIYGPCVANFGMEPWHPSLEDAMELLCGERDTVCGYDGWEKESQKSEENPLAPYHVTEERKIKSFVGRKPVMWAVPHKENVLCGEPEEDCYAAGSLQFEGRLLGGCMDCLVNLLGTRFDRTKTFTERYREDGIIWFLEACDLNVFSIRRAMWQMEEAGWFRYVKGFLIGRPLCFGQEMMGLDAYQAVLEVAGRKNVPIIMDVDLGHLPPMMPLVVGSLAQVKVCGNDISVKMKFV